MKQVILTHPIDHNGTRYDRGFHELDDVIADHFIDNLSHAAQRFVPSTPPRRKTSRELFAEAEAAKQAEQEEKALAKKAAKLFEDGKTAGEVAAELGITPELASGLRPEAKQ